jgi:hypothetical protein
VQLTVDERRAFEGLTESERAARRLEGADLIDWYRQELKRIEDRANRSDREVQRTLAWSLPFLRDVIAGRIAPVRPPPTVARGSRLADVLGVEVSARKKNATLKLHKTRAA